MIVQPLIQPALWVGSVLQRQSLRLALAWLLLLPQPTVPVRLVLHLTGNFEELAESRTEEERAPGEEIGIVPRGDRVPSRSLWCLAGASGTRPPVQSGMTTAIPTIRGEYQRRDQLGAGVRLRC